MKQELLFPDSISLFQVNLHEKNVIRKDQIRTIYLYLQKEQLVYIEGPENIGKTTLLKQIVSDRNFECISIFIDEYDCEYVTENDIYKDIYLQSRVLTGQYCSSDKDNIVNREVYTSSMSSFNYYLREKNKSILFVLDGFDKLNEKNPTVAKEVLGSLTANKSAKYIISTNDIDIKDYIYLRDPRSFPLTVMSEQEAKELLPTLTKDELEDVINSFGTMPDKLSIVARLLDENKAIDDILQNTDTDTDTLYDAEWKHAIKNEIQEKITGYIAFSNGKLSINDLSQCVNVQPIEIEQEVNNISFINITDDAIHFVSDGFKKYARIKLDSQKLSYLEVIISLVENHKLEETSESLSLYYSEAGKHQSIIQHIDEHYLSDLYSRKLSYNDLLKNIRLALESSVFESNNGKTAKFAHLKSFILNIESDEISLEEMKCYLSNGDYKSAKDLAETPQAIEDKIKLYCLIAIHYKDQNIEIPEDIQTKIQKIYTNLSVQSLADEKVIDIAVDLFPIYPELSMDLLSQIDKTHSSGQNQSDFAFLKLSLETLKRHGNSLSEDLEEFDRVLDKKSSMLEGIKIFNPDSPVQKILEYIDSQKQPGDKIFLLRGWLSKYHEKESALLLLNKLLELILETIDFSSDATLFADISQCLTSNHAIKNADAENAYQTIVAQLKNISEKGPTIEYSKVEVSLAIYEHNNEKYKKERLSNLINYLINLEDKSVALACLSLVSSAFKVINDEDCKSLVCEKKKDIFESLLKSEALHIDVFKDAIKHEVKIDIERTFTWINKLNTSERKDASIKAAIESYIESYGDIEHKDRIFNYWLTKCRIIKDDHFRSSVCKHLMGIFEKSKCSKRDYSDALKYINRIENTPIKIKSLTALSSSAIKKGIINEVEEKVKENIDSFILDIVDGDWNKVSLYFYVCNKLYDVDIITSNHFKEKAISMRKSSDLVNDSINNYMTHTSDLIIRSIYVLSKHQLVPDDKLNLALNFISFIPSRLYKVSQLSRLASVYQKNSFPDKAKHIIDNYLIPALDNNSGYNNVEFTISCEASLPVIYYYSSDVFDLYFTKINKRNKLRSDKIIDNCISYIYNDCILNDPYNPVKNKQYKLTYADLVSVTKLIKNYNDDSAIVYQVSNLIEVIESQRKKNSITRMQISSIVDMIKNDILTLLPKVDGITHEGYSLLVKANILLLDNKDDKSAWNNIISKAKNIDSTSDLSFTLANIASYLPNSMKQVREELYKESESLVDSLNCKSEQVTRYRQICDFIKESDMKHAKSIIKKAIYISSRSDIDPNSPTRLNAIDMCHKLGDSFAGSLSSMFDEDPARKQAIQDNIQQKLEEDKQRKKFEKNEIDFESPLAFELPELAWKQLGSINANSCYCSKGFDINKNLNIVSNFSFGDFYKLLSFYIHYIDNVSPGQKTAKERIFPILDELLKNMSLIKDIFSSELIPSVIENIESSLDHIMIGEGEEDLAIKFIKKWYEEENISDFTIIDPYFSLDDLVPVSEVINRDPEVRIQILTSIDNYNKIKNKHGDDFAEIIDKYWNDNISNSDHPSFEFTFAGYGQKNQIPIHDRWWLSPNSGLAIGTSLNGLGKRISQISKLTLDERASVNEKVSPLLDRKMGRFSGEKVKYKMEVI
ncbi:hypothetical protein AB6E36_12335 [Vibrio cyclitrophicus]